MEVLLCAAALVLSVYLVIKLITFLILGGVQAPMIGFSVIIGIGVWSSVSLIGGIIAAIAAFVLMSVLGRYQKIFAALTTLAACFTSFCIIIFLLSLAKIWFNIDNVANWTRALACVIVAAISVKMNLDNENANFAEGNETLCRVVASILYGFTAMFIFAQLVGFGSSVLTTVLEYIVWIGGAVAAYMIDRVAPTRA